MNLTKDKQRSTNITDKNVNKQRSLVTRVTLLDKQRSTNITHKTKDPVTRTSLKTNNDLQTSQIKLKIQ